MPKDMKEYNRKYYATNSFIWKNNYEANADARRESARTRGQKRWEEDPEYRAAQTQRTIERTRRNRQAHSLAAASEKIYNALKNISENFS